MAARSRSATRSACRARGSRSPRPRSCSAAAAGSRSPPCASASGRESRSRSNGCRLPVMGGVATKTVDEAAIMAVLEAIPDPEIPVLTITDLGIVRGIRHDPPRVLVSPTYTGCPATVAIENSIREALDQAGFEDVHVERVLFPPWSTEWISDRGRERLHAYG